jgi:hypothetical protein
MTFLLALLISCTSHTDNGNLLIKTMIKGSTESPDIVLKKIVALEKDGLIYNLIILESFPLQIHFEATQKVINEVKAIISIN